MNDVDHHRNFIGSTFLALRPSLAKLIFLVVQPIFELLIGLLDFIDTPEVVHILHRSASLRVPMPNRRHQENRQQQVDFKGIYRQHNNRFDQLILSKIISVTGLILVTSNAGIVNGLLANDKVNHFYSLDFRNSFLDRFFNPGFEGHGRHGAIAACSKEFKFYNVIVGDFHDFYIATVRFQVRSD
jgi:hypothetical protein